MCLVNMITLICIFRHLNLNTSCSIVNTHKTNLVQLRPSTTHRLPKCVNLDLHITRYWCPRKRLRELIIRITVVHGLIPLVSVTYVRHRLIKRSVCRSIWYDAIRPGTYFHSSSSRLSLCSVRQSCCDAASRLLSIRLTLACNTPQPLANCKLRDFCILVAVSHIRIDYLMISSIALVYVVE